MMSNERRLFLFFTVLLILEFFLFIDLPAFWDAKSKFVRASWLYENNFADIIVPTDLNSGHPPLWILSIAVFWKLLGKAIWSARLLLLFINIGLLYQVIKLAKNSFTTVVPIFMVVLLLLEPTLIAQTTNLNNDMMLLFFVLLGINSLLKQNTIWYTIALVGMLFTNLRGIYCVLALGIIHLILHRKHLVQTVSKFSYAYIIAAMAFGGFLLYQYMELGWVLITKNQSYAEHREAAPLMRILKNTAAFTKNMLDFGRVFVWVPMMLMLWLVWRRKTGGLSREAQIIGISLLVFTLVFFLGMVPFSNPMGPRYLMICFLLANLLFIMLLFESGLLEGVKRKVLIGIVGLAFLGGHFWIYPATIAQGWDSSLAYLNYFKQEEKMFGFIKERRIPPESIGTNLPLNVRWISLAKTSNEGEMHFEEVDFEKNAYILFSNIENRTSDESIKMLQNTWEPIKHCERLGVFLTLYKNPNVQ